MKNTTGRGSDEDSMLLVEILKKGMQSAKQAKNHLNATFRLPNREIIELAVGQIEYWYEMAMVKCGGGSSSSLGELQAAAADEPPHRLSESRKIEDSDRDFRDQAPVRDASKKRKNMQEKTQQVNVDPRTGHEELLDDGFSWRKYGNKFIKGTKNPKSYYRCTHPNAQICQAKKLVQMSDEDPTVYYITYRGTHTCSQSSLKSTPPPQNQEPSLISTISQEQQDQKNLRFETKSSKHIISPEHPLSSSHHPNDAVSPNFMVDNSPTRENISHSVVPPATTDNNYFTSPSSGTINKNNNFNLQASESQMINDVIPAATSVTNSMTAGMEIPFDFELDSYFTFKGSEMLPSLSFYSDSLLSLSPSYD